MYIASLCKHPSYLSAHTHSHLLHKLAHPLSESSAAVKSPWLTSYEFLQVLLVFMASVFLPEKNGYKKCTPPLFLLRSLGLTTSLCSLSGFALLDSLCPFFQAATQSTHILVIISIISCEFYSNVPSMLPYPAICVDCTETVLLVEEILYQNYAVKNLVYGTYKINTRTGW